MGDDYQLPPIDVGAFYCLGKRTLRQRTRVEELFVQNGMDLFLEFGKDVMTLAQTKRVLEGQTQLQHILNKVKGLLEYTLSKKCRIPMQLSQ